MLHNGIVVVVSLICAELNMHAILCMHKKNDFVLVCIVCLDAIFSVTETTALILHEGLCMI